MPQLKKRDISLAEMVQISREYYRQNDNKPDRGKVDVKSGRIVARNNYTFDRSTQTWEQTGRNFKFVFKVKTDPVSYKKQDTVKNHFYPVTFLIRNIDQGAGSAFRWRTGGFRRPILLRGKQSAKARQTAVNANIRNGVQMQFFFELMHILSLYGLLYGPNTTNRKLPRKTNPDLTPFFDKHAWYVLMKILFPILNGKKTAAIGSGARNN